ncbi:hypothetical protein BT96DRAFT_918521, partial [Gymnopus androsaceus JB14]
RLLQYVYKHLEGTRKHLLAGLQDENPTGIRIRSRRFKRNKNVTPESFQGDGYPKDVADTSPSPSRVQDTSPSRHHRRIGINTVTNSDSSSSSMSLCTASAAIESLPYDVTPGYERHDQRDPIQASRPVLFMMRLSICLLQVALRTGRLPNVSRSTGIRFFWCCYQL